MDKNTIIGFVLILAIIVGFSWYSRPSEEELARQRAYRDSIAAIEAREPAQEIRQYMDPAEASAASDSLRTADEMGAFAPFAQGTDTAFVLDNGLIRADISTKGARVSRVELKQYKAYGDSQLILFDEKDAEYGFTLLTANNRVVDSKDLYFVGTQLNDSTLMFTLPVAGGSEFQIFYVLPSNSYMMDVYVNALNMKDYLSQRSAGLDLQWSMRIKQQEKGRKFENRYSGVYYKYLGDDVENLSNEESDAEQLSNRVKWIGFKDQFFSSVLIADDYFGGVALESEMLPNSSPYLKSCKAEMTVGFDPSGGERTHLRVFFGPNQYKILHAFDDDVPSEERLDMDDMLPLGWSLFGWINKYLIIPIFNFLGQYIDNYGIIILLLTIIIKLILLPFTFKSYMSSAKMRVLRPQIEEINQKYPPEKAMERQQATMALYNRAGVSPMGGCLPMLLQLPILYAMFSFFPACIELRQQPFLWADDLSAYDAILSWDVNIPIISSIYGNHVSLFCLLMCVTNIIYTYINMKDQPSNAQMPMMKWMMYLMPIMFLFIFNDYAAGLSYYYLVSLLITILQTYIFRWSVNDQKVLAKLNANQNKPRKKSKFMERMEQMQKEQQQYQRELAKTRQQQQQRGGQKGGRR